MSTGPKKVIQFSGAQPAASQPLAENQIHPELQAQIRSGMPLPVGKIIVASDDKLTPFERDHFGKLGVKSGDSIPGNMADIVEAAREQALAEVAIARPAVDPAMPKIDPKVVDIRQLPEEVQARYREIVSSALKDFRQGKKSDGTSLAGRGPGVAQAIQSSKPPVSEADPVPTTTPPPVPDTRFTWDQPMAGTVPAEPAQEPVSRYVVPPGAETPPAAPESPQEEEPEDGKDPTGATQHLKNCPFCHFDLTTNPPWENPTVEEARDFLATLIGQRHYVKRFEVMGGRLKIDFRTISPSEVDLCYRQIYLDQMAGRIATAEDSIEWLTRYQTYLRLKRVEFGDECVYEFPDSVDGWNLPEAEEGETKLPQIRDALWKSVLTSDVIHRVIGQYAAIFHKLVGRLEVLVQDSDFWKGIVTQP